MSSPHRQLQKAIRIRQFQEGEPNNDTPATPIPETFGLPFRDAIWVDEPVFSYITGNGDASLANFTNNQAYRTAGASTDSTASSDIYVAPSLDGNTGTYTLKSLYFDCDETTGRPYLAVPWFAERENTSAMTFECLFKPTSYDSNDTEHVLYASNNQYLAGVGYRIAMKETAVSLRYTVDTVTRNVVMTGLSIPLNQVYHLVFTIDNTPSGTVVAYLNGQLVGTESMHVTDIIGANDQEEGTIGGLTQTNGVSGTNQFYFNGSIAFVTQYDKILTQADVTRHYNALGVNRHSLAPAFDLPTAYVVDQFAPDAFWICNGQEEGGATSFGDSSANSNTATRYNDVQMAATSLWAGGKAALFLPKSTSDIAYLQTNAVSNTLQHNITSTFIATISPTANTGDETWIDNKIMSNGDIGISGQQQIGWAVDSSGRLTCTYYYTSVLFETLTSTVAIPDYVTDGSASYDVTMTVNDTTNEVKFYVDGEQLGDTLTTSFSVRGNTQCEAFVGTWGTGAAGQSGFHGFLDNIGYFQRILTAQEIQSIHRCRSDIETEGGALDDYVARWSLDDVTGSTAPNHQVNGSALDGTLVNSPTRTVGYDDLTDGALQFDGVDQRVDLSGRITALENSASTICGWVKCATLPLANVQAIYSNQSTSGGQYLYLREDGEIVGSNLNPSASAVETSGFKFPNDGEFHHLAWTRSSSEGVLYLDGIVVASNGSQTAATYGTDNRTAIGARTLNAGSTFDRYFEGELDDMRYYDRELTGQEIWYLSQTTIPPKPQDMIAEWKFENNLNDNVGSNNLTALQGSPSYLAGVGWENQGNQFSGSVMGFDSVAAFELQTFSVSFFQKFYGGAGTTQRPIANYFQDNSNPINRWGWYVQKGSGETLNFYEWDGTDTTVSGNVVTNNLEIRKVPENAWQHICFVRTPTGSTLYVDGEVALATDAPSGNISYAGATQQFTIGGVRNISTYISEVNADIDEVRYYNRELTQDEVRSIALRDDFSTIGDGVAPEEPPTPPSYDPLVADIDVASITETVSNGDYTTATLTASVTGGSGQFTYAWTTDGEATFSDSDGLVTTATWLNKSQETISETLTFTVTDTGNGDDTASDTCPVSVTFGFTDDYVAYWNYETDQITGLVVADQTSNNHDATMQVNPVAADGADGLGLQFDNPNQYATVVDSADFKSTSFSLSVWMKPDSTVVGDSIFQSGDFGTTKAGWHLFRTSANALKFQLGNNTGAVFDTDWTDFSTVNNIVNTTEYKHVVLTYNGTTAKIYVNGVEAATKDWSGLAFPATNYVSIGAGNSNGTYTAPFNGDLDETKVYTRALSSVEVTELYNQPRTPETAPEPYGVTIDPANVAQLVFPNGPYSGDQDAVVSGGTGPFTYLWTKESGTAGYDITAGSTSPTVTIGGTGSGEETYTFKVVVTDTGNGNVTTEATTTHIINFGAV